MSERNNKKIKACIADGIPSIPRFLSSCNNNTTYSNTRIMQYNNQKTSFNIEKKQQVNSKINSNELILIYNCNLKSYQLVKFRDLKSCKNSFVFGLDEKLQLKEIPIEGIEETPRDISLNITFKHGILSLSKQHKLLSVDEELNIIQIAAEEVEIGTPILMPRVIDIIEDDSPLDFSNCGEIIVEDGIEYVKKALTKAFRYVEKNFEVGYILGHYCSEGYMEYTTFTCGNNKDEMEKVAHLIEKNFGYSPYIGKHEKEGYKTVYSVNSNSILMKLIFTIGLGLKAELAPFKEIPPFLYNAPIECVKGFIAAFLEGDGSSEDRIRINSSTRDVDIRFFTSSRKLTFGLSFLLKRLGIAIYILLTEFDKNEHPTWYDAYTLRIKGKRSLNILREFIPYIPKIGHFGRDKEPALDLNPWMKKLNIELKKIYGISLRMLSEKGKIPYIAARCAQQNSTMNISEAKLLITLKFLVRSELFTPTLCKLWNIFARNTFTKVKSIEVFYEINDVYDILVPFYGVYIVGIGQIYIKN